MTCVGDMWSGGVAVAYTQLQMTRDLEDLPEIRMPTGYEMRTYQPDDETAWAEIMNAGLGEGWDAAKARRALMDRPGFHPGKLFFAIYQGRPVGSACAWHRVPGEPQ